MPLYFGSYHQLILLLVLINTTIPTCLGSSDTINSDALNNDTLQSFALARGGSVRGGSRVDPYHDSTIPPDTNSEQVKPRPNDDDLPQGNLKEPDSKQPNYAPEPPLTSSRSAWNKERFNRLAEEMKNIADILRSCIPFIHEMNEGFSTKSDQPGACAQPCTKFLYSCRAPGWKYNLTILDSNNPWPSILDPMLSKCQDMKMALSKGWVARSCQEGLISQCSTGVQVSYQLWYEMGDSQCYEGLRRSPSSTSTSSSPSAIMKSMAASKLFSGWTITGIGALAANLL
jgi:hypothetical protein